ncbi:MAG: insulinase family protein, partial [Acidobacteria bacterium]|nr:insulinase family protein [Acidobacteriota bacterium]
MTKRNLSQRLLALFLTLASLALVAPTARYEPTAHAAQAAAAQQQRAAAPAPQKSPAQAAPTFQPAQLTSRVLSNGLEVVVMEDHSVPVVTIELAVRNGSFTEPPELNGLSHLYEHMFFKANRAAANQEDYLKNIDQLGIAYNGTTREEIVEYYYTTISPNFAVAMRAMRDAARYPLFDEKQFEQEREVVINELQ